MIDIVERMSSGEWFITPSGESRIDNAISAVKQAGSWIVEHNDIMPTLASAVVMVLFATGATRYLLVGRGEAIHRILSGGDR